MTVWCIFVFKTVSHS